MLFIIISGTTNTPDIAALVVEGISITNDPEHPAHGLFTVDEDGAGLTFNVSKVPVVYSEDNSTVSLVRGVPEGLFDSVTSIEAIGYYDPVSASYVFYEGGQDKYESVYDVTPKSIDGEVYTPTYMIGVFA